MTTKASSQFLQVDGLNKRPITQATHNFIVGNLLYLNGTTYTKARADADTTSEVVGIVAASQDANTFTLATGGYITGLSGLTAGAVYFLSSTTAGLLTTTEPAIGDISKPVLIADTTTSGYFFNMRGVVVPDLFHKVVDSSSVASHATPTPDSDTTAFFAITALAAAAAFAAPTGTPVDGQKLLIRIKDNGTARALTWNAIYRAGDTALPTTTVINKTMYVGFIYNAADSKWDFLANQGGF